MAARRIQLVIKRLIDLLGSIVLLVLLSPVLIVVAIAIKRNSRGPVFFRQERLGHQGRTFRIFKFRTMVPDAERIGTGLMTHDGDSRITRVGNVLRNYRLDELPQLFNVVRGEMSLVGPRPLLPQFLEHYSETDRRRLLMPPGMTGWQQVKGGSLNTWEERIALDVWYVDHWNLWLDIKTLLMTVMVVIKADTVYGADGRQLSGLPTSAREEFLSGSQPPDDRPDSPGGR